MLKYFKKKKVKKLRYLLDSYEKQGYHTERIDITKLCWSIFSKDFKVGDKITWLGHDNVFGLMHGEKFTADQEAVDKKEDFSFWLKIDELNFQPCKDTIKFC